MALSVQDVDILVQNAVKRSPAIFRVYDRFIAYLLPAKSETETSDSIIETLRTLFRQPTSLFRRRFKLLQTRRDGLDINDLIGIINTRGEAAELAKLTPEHLKCLVLVNALAGAEDLEIRTRALRKLHDETTKLKGLAKELLDYTQLWNDATVQSENKSAVLSRKNPQSSKPRKDKNRLLLARAAVLPIIGRETVLSPKRNVKFARKSVTSHPCVARRDHTRTFAGFKFHFSEATAFQER